MPTTTRRSTRLAAQPNTNSAVTNSSSAPVVTPQKRKSRASKSKLTKGTKKRRTGLRNTVNTSKSLGTVDPESNIDGSILDIDGKMIQNKTIHAGQTLTYFDLQTLYEGNYIISVKTDNSYTSKKFQIQRK